MNGTLRRPLAAILVLGALLLLGGAFVHPILAGDAAAKLAMIAATPHWRAIHLTMLTGTGLVLAGLWALLDPDPSRYAARLPALILLALGQAINAINVLFMTGAGAEMARLASIGTAGIEVIFQATHPFGLMASRFGNFLVALSGLWLGAIYHADQREPRWLGPLAGVAGAVGLAAVVFCRESTLYILLPIGLLSLWEIGAGLAVLRARPAGG